MEEALFKGIYKHYNDDTTGLKTTVSNGLYPGFAPQGTTEPYGTYQIISNVPDEGFDFVLDETLVQFDYWSKMRSPSSIWDIAADSRKRFDWATISTTASTLYTHVSMAREWTRMFPEVEGDEIRWRYTAQYRVTWESTGNKP